MPAMRTTQDQVEINRATVDRDVISPQWSGDSLVSCCTTNENPYRRKHWWEYQKPLFSLSVVCIDVQGELSERKEHLEAQKFM